MRVGMRSGEVELEGYVRERGREINEECVGVGDGEAEGIVWRGRDVRFHAPRQVHGMAGFKFQRWDYSKLMSTLVWCVPHT